MNDSFKDLKERLKKNNSVHFAEKYQKLLKTEGSPGLIKSIIDDTTAGVLTKDDAIALLQFSHDSLMKIAVEYSLKLTVLKAKAESPGRQFRWGLIAGLVLSVFLEIVARYLRSL